MLHLHLPHLDKAEAVTNPVLLNMAAVQLRTTDWPAAAHNATQVQRRRMTKLKLLVFAAALLLLLLLLMLMLLLMLQHFPLLKKVLKLHR